MRGQRAPAPTNAEGEVDENFWAQAAADQAAGRSGGDDMDDSKLDSPDYYHSIDDIAQLAQEMPSHLTHNSSMTIMMMDLGSMMLTMVMVAMVVQLIQGNKIFLPPRRVKPGGLNPKQ